MNPTDKKEPFDYIAAIEPYKGLENAGSGETTQEGAKAIYEAIMASQREVFTERYSQERAAAVKANRPESEIAKLDKILADLAKK